MKYSFFLCVLLICISFQTYSQKKEDRSAAVQAGITLRSYIFHAQTALPASGRSRQLTSAYSFTVIKDSIISDLPYFGRAYSAPFDPAQSALQFSSRKFEYAVNKGKKGGWNIEIKFRDVREVQSVFLSISKEGYGTLRVIPTNRQTISFTGSVDKK